MNCNDIALISKECGQILGKGGDHAHKEDVQLGPACSDIADTAGAQYSTNMLACYVARDGRMRRIWSQPPSSLIPALLYDIVV